MFSAKSTERKKLEEMHKNKTVVIPRAQF